MEETELSQNQEKIGAVDRALLTLCFKIPAESRVIQQLPELGITPTGEENQANSRSASDMAFFNVSHPSFEVA